MPQRSVAIASSVGLHARPAAMFTQAVAASGLPVMIASETKGPVDAASMLRVMALGVQHNQTVTLTVADDADAADADRVLDELVALLATDLDAEPE